MHALLRARANCSARLYAAALRRDAAQRREAMEAARLALGVDSSTPSRDSSSPALARGDDAQVAEPVGAAAELALEELPLMEVPLRCRY